MCLNSAAETLHVCYFLSDVVSNQVAVNAIHALNEIEADSGGVLVTRGLMTSFLNR